MLHGMTCNKGAYDHHCWHSANLTSDQFCHALTTAAMGMKGIGLIGRMGMALDGMNAPAFELSFERDGASSVLSGISRATSLAESTGTKLGEFAFSCDTSDRTNPFGEIGVVVSPSALAWLELLVMFIWDAMSS